MEKDEKKFGYLGYLEVTYEFWNFFYFCKKKMLFRFRYGFH